MRIRLIVAIAVFSIIVLGVGYHLTRADLEAVAAEPAPGKASLNSQATTLEEVQARGEQVAAAQAALFADELFDYQITYPANWEQVKVAINQTLFRSPSGVTEVKVEVVGPLPADGLAAFVNRSLGDNIVINRQLLTVHGLAAERVLAHSDKIGGQVTMFFIDAGQSAYVITGFGEQKAIEMIARSFNVPRTVAQK